MSDLQNYFIMMPEEIELEKLPNVSNRYKKKQKRTPYTFHNRDQYGMLYDILIAITETKGLSTTRIAYTVTTHEKIVKKYLQVLKNADMVIEINNPNNVKDLRTLSGNRVYFEITEKGKDMINRLSEMFEMISKDFFISYSEKYK